MATGPELPAARHMTSSTSPDAALNPSLRPRPSSRTWAGPSRAEPGRAGPSRAELGRAGATSGNESGAARRGESVPAVVARTGSAVAGPGGGVGAGDGRASQSGGKSVLLVALSVAELVLGAPAVDLGGQVVDVVAVGEVVHGVLGFGDRAEGYHEALDQAVLA